MRGRKPICPLPLCCALWVASLAGCPSDPAPSVADNEAPVVRALWPQLWPVAEPAPIDVSASADPDGFIKQISLSFGDGTPEQTSADGIFLHTFPSAGTFALRFVVEDDAGAQTELLGSIVIAEAVDDPACDCENPCFAPGVCSQDRCYQGAASASDEAPVAPSDPLDCSFAP